MEPTSLERVPLTEQLVQRFSALITEATWPSGMLLAPEPQLAQQFGVSRAVIRECVRVLVSRGMLDVRQGRGTLVNAPSAWRVTEPLELLVKADRAELLNWLEVRTILEVESAALAAQRASEVDLRALDEALAQLEASVSDHHSYAVADVVFHLCVAQGTQNMALYRLLRPVVQPLREHLQETTLLPEARRAANAEHHQIVACIRQGKAQGAREAMAAHLARVADEITQILQQRAVQEVDDQ